MAALRKITKEFYIREIDPHELTNCDIEYYYYKGTGSGPDSSFIDITSVRYNGLDVDSLFNSWMWDELESELLEEEGNML